MHSSRPQYPMVKYKLPDICDTRMMTRAPGSTFYTAYILERIIALAT